MRCLYMRDKLSCKVSQQKSSYSTRPDMDKLDAFERWIKVFCGIEADPAFSQEAVVTMRTVEYPWCKQ